MKYQHIFKAALNWKQPATSIHKIYNKSHQISIVGKADMQVSAAKAFKGDPALYNPEDMLLSSLMSCHMMSYLYVCDRHAIEVISYSDHAEAVLEVDTAGSGRIVQVHLTPRVTIRNAAQIELALSLHKEANKLCFIANSCNFPVHHHAKCNAI